MTLTETLKAHSIVITQSRLNLLETLLSYPGRSFTAEDLSIVSRMKLRSTYNTLNLFAEKGLVLKTFIKGSRQSSFKIKPTKGTNK